MQELVLVRCTPGADLVQNIDFSAISELVDSISPDGSFVEQELGSRTVQSSKLFFLMTLSSTESSGKLSMAVVSTVVVEPESELSDSVVIRGP